MVFEIRVTSNTPLIGETDPEIAAKKFFQQIGYLSKGSDPSIPYQLFAEYFIKHPTKAWYVEELAVALKTSKPTIYRHLNKLKGFDVLEEISVKLNTSKPTVYRHLNKLKGFDILEEIHVFDKNTQQNKKAYRLRYGDFKKSWNFVEAHIKVAVENYGKTVEHIQKLMEEQKKVNNE